MSLRAATACAALALAASTFATAASAAPAISGRAATTTAVTAPRPHRPGEVLIVRHASDDLDLAPAGRLGARDATLSRLLLDRGLDRWEPLGPVRAGRRAAFARLVSHDPGFDPVAVARELVESGAVRAAIPNRMLDLHVTMPNDTYLAEYQYAIQAGNDADVDLPEAWDVTTGDTSVVIGVVDTGVDTGHPDLASKIFRNWAEIPDNAFDDDGNGYVDDVNGWDFGDGDADPNPTSIFDSSGLDVGFHGTFVSAVAAAATNNVEGVAGAAWGCRILPLKVANSAGELSSAALTEAVLYAADIGAEVLNMSLGSPAAAGIPEFYQALVDAYTATGGLLVASAGNDGTSALNYPAASAGVLAVGATDDANARASFSNFGPWVDLAAPGATIWSALSRNYEIDPLTQFFFQLFFLWDGENPYMYCDGTSFSSPLVAGTAALVRSAYPWMSGLDVGAHLVSTGDVVAYSQPIGRKLNAFTAVSTNPVAVPAASAGARGLTLLGASPHPVRDGATLRFMLANGSRARLRLYDTQGRLVRTLADGEFAAGPHSLGWDATDASGRPLPGGVYHLALDAAGERATRRLVVMR